MYSTEQIDELHGLSREYYAKCFKLQARLVLLSESMSNGAKEHAVYGIARRLRTIFACVKFFFEKLPPNLTSEAESEVQSQGNANLHAFLINCCGINDNIAWFLAYHIGLDQEIDLEKNKHDIGLFRKEFKKHLPENVLEKVESFKEWHKFIVNQRHPTAHRIPPYIIPYIQSTTTGNIDYTPYYIHAFDKSHPVPLHAQVICDVGAILELVEAMLDDVRAR